MEQQSEHRLFLPGRPRRYRTGYPMLRWLASILCVSMASSILPATSALSSSTTLVEDTEIVLDGALPALMRVLSRSAKNQALPSPEARHLFAETVNVIDTHIPEALSRIEALGLTRRHWQPGHQPSRISIRNLAIWDTYFEGLSYFTNATFVVIRGHFLDAKHQTLETTLKFTGLARTVEGYQFAKARISVQWHRNNGDEAKSAAEPAWNIHAWKTLTFETHDVDRLLFTDVFSDRVEDTLYRQVAERAWEVDWRAAWIVVSQHAKLTSEQFHAVLDDRLLPYSRSEIESVMPQLDPRGQRYVALRYGEKVQNQARLQTLLGITESGLSDIASGIKEKLDAARTAQRPEVAVRAKHGDHLRQQVGATRRSGTLDSSAMSVTDIDGDGFDDIFVSRNARNYLLRNCGDGTFEDHTAQVDLPQSTRSINAALFIDVDNDGDVDLFYGFLNGLGYFINDNGRFVDRTESLLNTYQPRGYVALSAADYNSDGLLDVYVQTHEIFDPSMEMLARTTLGFDDKRLYGAWLPDDVARRFYAHATSGDIHTTFDRPGPPNILLCNRGAGRFDRAPETEQLELFRSTHAAAWSDFDSDGDPDLYVANDFAPNNFFRNDDGVLVDVTHETRTSDIGFGMGVAWGDYDNDGDHDLYVTNMYSKAGLRITRQSGLVDTRAHLAAHGNTLFQNNPDRFLKVSGEAPPDLAVEPGGWGWGAQFIDVDNDGFLDIYAPSGYISTPKGFAQLQDT